MRGARSALMWGLLLGVGVGLAGCNASAQEYSPEVMRALQAQDSGDYAAAYRMWSDLAEHGDVKAATMAGMLAYDGKGMAADPVRAFDWWLRGYPSNGDAIGNIGVAFRDGKGVPRNPPIALALFLYVYMEGRGSDATQIRNNSNLRRLLDSISKEDRAHALCSTLPYVDAYVRSRGTLKGMPAKFEPTADHPRIKDNGWWSPEEREDMKTVECQ